MRHLPRWYGAGPLHLLALLAGFALAGYAAVQLVGSRPLAVAVWFLGAVIGHDLLLMPLYSLADRSVLAVLRHRAPALPAVAWINYVRVPAALSGLLLLVWFPLILRLTATYHASTTLSPGPYVWHWLAVTGALFLLSAAAFAARLRGIPQDASLPDEEEGPARSVAGTGRVLPAWPRCSWLARCFRPARCFQPARCFRPGRRERHATPVPARVPRNGPRMRPPPSPAWTKSPSLNRRNPVRRSRPRTQPSGSAVTPGASGCEVNVWSYACGCDGRPDTLRPAAERAAAAQRGPAPSHIGLAQPSAESWMLHDREEQSWPEHPGDAG